MQIAKSLIVMVLALSAQSREFYGKLFGWQFMPVKGTDQAVEIVAGSTAIGAIRVAEGRDRRSSRSPVGLVLQDAPSARAAQGKLKPAE